MKMRIQWYCVWFKIKWLLRTCSLPHPNSHPKIMPGLYFCI